VDAQQLALMAKLFIDVCKPLDERVLWQGSEIKKLGSGKRQQSLEGVFTWMSSRQGFR
jgi:hypothetical protein